MGITKNLQVSVEKKLHDEASSLFSELGLSTGAVVNAMLRRAVLTQSVPFEISKDVSNNQDLNNQDLKGTSSPLKPQTSTACLTAPLKSW
ncbi:hypothetical protein FM106_23955 [Brachybacterium faecium]|nr:hypothetical protein FM106_23955 [Brachybacterium faecium]